MRGKKVRERVKQVTNEKLREKSENLSDLCDKKSMRVNRSNEIKTMRVFFENYVKNLQFFAHMGKIREYRKN